MTLVFIKIWHLFSFDVLYCNADRCFWHSIQVYRTDWNLFNLQRLKAKTKVMQINLETSHLLMNEHVMLASTEMQQSMDLFASACSNFGKANT